MVNFDITKENTKKNIVQTGLKFLIICIEY